MARFSRTFERGRVVAESGTAPSRVQVTRSTKLDVGVHVNLRGRQGAHDGRALAQLDGAADVEVGIDGRAQNHDGSRLNLAAYACARTQDEQARAQNLSVDASVDADIASERQSADQARIWPDVHAEIQGSSACAV